MIFILSISLHSHMCVHIMVRALHNFWEWQPQPHKSQDISIKDSLFNVKFQTIATDTIIFLLAMFAKISLVASKQAPSLWCRDINFNVTKQHCTDSVIDAHGSDAQLHNFKGSRSSPLLFENIWRNMAPYSECDIKTCIASFTFYKQLNVQKSSILLYWKNQSCSTLG